MKYNVQLNYSLYSPTTIQFSCYYPSCAKKTATKKIIWYIFCRNYTAQLEEVHKQAKEKSGSFSFSRDYYKSTKTSSWDEISNWVHTFQFLLWLYTVYPAKAGIKMHALGLCLISAACILLQSLLTFFLHLLAGGGSSEISDKYYKFCIDNGKFMWRSWMKFIHF